MFPSKASWQAWPSPNSVHCQCCLTFSALMGTKLSDGLTKEVICYGFFFFLVLYCYSFLELLFLLHYYLLILMYWVAFSWEFTVHWLCRYRYIFFFFYVNRSIGFLQIFDFPFLTDLHVLECSEHDLTISVFLTVNLSVCLSVCLCVCDKHFVANVTRELMNRISWNFVFSITPI